MHITTLLLPGLTPSLCFQSLVSFYYCYITIISYSFWKTNSFYQLLRSLMWLQTFCTAIRNHLNKNTVLIEDYYHASLKISLCLTFQLLTLLRLATLANCENKGTPVPTPALQLILVSSSGIHLTSCRLLVIFTHTFPAFAELLHSDCKFLLFTLLSL